MANEEWPVHGEITGPLVMIGFGSIGRGALPLIERHFRFDKSRMVVIDPSAENRRLLDERGIAFVQKAVTKDNYRELLTPLLTTGGQAFCVNLSVDTGSVDLMRLTRELGALYVDTVVEPWLGFYFDADADNASRTNYALRESLLAEKRRKPGGTTAVSTCGANPGMVSWFVKKALVELSRDLGLDFEEPAQNDREGWARLMRQAGVKGVHIAERDTQRARKPKPMNVFWNTWSVEGFVAEGLQPAELGWGTHERALPADGRRHESGSGSAIYLLRPGAVTRVRSWTPQEGHYHGFLITHSESISLADYFTLRDGDAVVYRPTVHYAYHPCDAAVLSLHEFAGRNFHLQPRKRIVMDEIAHGVDELGVLLAGHTRNAYWFGSLLSIEDTRALVPHNNATSLQVTVAVLAGMVWAMENPVRGIVEPEEMDFRRALEICRPYLGHVHGAYTDWHPLCERGVLFPEDVDGDDPWQFRNVRV